MKSVNTDKLIDELVADFRSVRPRRQSMILAIMLSTLASGGLFFLLVGFRLDALQAMLTARFLFKFVVTLSLEATAVPVVLRVGCVSAWNIDPSGGVTGVRIVRRLTPTSRLK